MLAFDQDAMAGSAHVASANPDQPISCDAAAGVPLHDAAIGLTAGKL
jgi:hypothetical protein